MFFQRPPAVDQYAARKRDYVQAALTLCRGGQRPRSSMAPTLVFKIAADCGKGDFVMATGSPGGGTIPPPSGPAVPIHGAKASC